MDALKTKTRLLTNFKKRYIE